MRGAGDNIRQQPRDPRDDGLALVGRECHYNIHRSPDQSDQHDARMRWAGVFDRADERLRDLLYFRHIRMVFWFHRVMLGQRHQIATPGRLQ